MAGFVLAKKNKTNIGLDETTNIVSPTDDDDDM